MCHPQAAVSTYASTQSNIIFWMRYDIELSGKYCPKEESPGSVAWPWGPPRSVLCPLCSRHAACGAATGLEPLAVMVLCSPRTWSTLLTLPRQAHLYTRISHLLPHINLSKAGFLKMNLKRNHGEDRSHASVCYWIVFIKSKTAMRL